jgi:hypothetical protein
MIDLTKLPPHEQEYRLALQIGDEEPVFYATDDAYNEALSATLGKGWIRIWRDMWDGTQQCKSRVWR